MNHNAAVKSIFVSGKGGTGKSTLAVNAALSFAYKGYRTLLLDMSMGLRTLDLYLGVQDSAIYDLYDVICGRCSIDRARITTKYSERLDLIPACQDRECSISSEDMGGFLSKVSGIYDFVLMDMPPGMSGIMEACVPHADAATIVLTSDYSAIRDADATEDFLIRNGIFNRNYIVNRMVPSLIKSGIEPGIQEIDSRLKCHMAGMVAEEESVRASTSAGVPAVSVGDSYVASNIMRIADRIIIDYCAR